MAVKSVRLGWPTGVRRAMEVLRSSVDWRDLLTAQVFEDIWPAPDELPEVLEEVRALDIEALCSRDTHHGRGLSGVYAELAPSIEKRIWREPGMASRVGAKARALGIGRLGKRAFSEFAIWLEASPEAGGKRTLDRHRWRGVPPAMADMHTPEGRCLGTPLTRLCGHPDGHLWLMTEVSEVGWEGVRRRVHEEEPLEGEIRQTWLWGGDEDGR